jgi:hypothetical protein
MRRQIMVRKALSSPLVIAGLDPAIHLLRKNLVKKSLVKRMDGRIKSGHDDV